MLKNSVLLDQRMLSLQLCHSPSPITLKSVDPQWVMMQRRVKMMQTMTIRKRSNSGSWVGCHGSSEESGDVNVHVDEDYS